MTYDYTGDEDWELSMDVDGRFKGKGKLLEIGCGTGQNVIPFVKLGYDVTGIELVKRRVELCRKNCKKHNVSATIVLGDAKDLPFADNTFDYVHNWGIIEHFPESEKSLTESYRVLKSGGELALQVPNALSFFTIISFFEKLSDKLLGTRYWTIGYEKPFTLWKIKDMVREAGFIITEIKLDQATSGRRFPLIHKINRIMDKPLYWLGVGGRSIEIFCIKK